MKRIQIKIILKLKYFKISLILNRFNQKKFLLIFFINFQFQSIIFIYEFIYFIYIQTTSKPVFNYFFSIFSYLEKKCLQNEYLLIFLSLIFNFNKFFSILLNFFCNLLILTSFPWMFYMKKILFPIYTNRMLKLRKNQNSFWKIENSELWENNGKFEKNQNNWK